MNITNSKAQAKHLGSVERKCSVTGSDVANFFAKLIRFGKVSLVTFGKNYSKFGQNCGEIWAKIIRSGKIKILHPQKQSISYGYDY